MRNFRCPKCGNRSKDFDGSDGGFELRGGLQNKLVLKCRQCGAGLLRRGILSSRLTPIPADTWAEMEREWEAHFGK